MAGDSPITERKYKSGQRTRIWNVLSILVLAAILFMVAWFILIFIQPFSPLNPFPPAALPTLVNFPTPADTDTPAPFPTETISASSTPSLTATWTSLPTSTSFFDGTDMSVYGTPTQTSTPNGLPFEASVTTLGSAYYHPEAGCNWMGVAGQAVGINNSPVLYLTIHISGTLGGKFIDYYSLTGTAPNYGQSGFEFVLGDKPIASYNSLWVQLLDQQNLPMSEKVWLTTYNDCNKNLVMIRFKKVQ